MTIPQIWTRLIAIALLTMTCSTGICSAQYSTRTLQPGIRTLRVQYVQSETLQRCTNKACDLQNETIFFNPEKEPYEIVEYERFLQQRCVTAEERNHIRITTSPDFVATVLHIPCAAASLQGFDVAIDPRYDRYDLAKFYTWHLQQGDLAICIQHHGNIERLLLTTQRNV